MSLTPGGAAPKLQKREKNKPLRRFIDSQPLCAICGRSAYPGNPITHHHLKRWGAGGVDRNNMIPAHWFDCHPYAHTFAFKDTDKLSAAVGQDLRVLAINLTSDWLAIKPAFLDKKGTPN
jgi:hypothetical protein